MGYEFRGFFTKNQQAANAAHDKWPFCTVKEVQEQMQGFVVKSPSPDDLHPTADQVEYDKVTEQFCEVEENLPAFSTLFADTMFVYIEVDCFGGICLYSGYHVQNGVKLKEFECGAESIRLKQILQPMDINWNHSLYFEPFTRGYFDA